MRPRPSRQVRRTRSEDHVSGHLDYTFPCFRSSRLQLLRITSAVRRGGGTKQIGLIGLRAHLGSPQAPFARFGLIGWRTMRTSAALLVAPSKAGWLLLRASGQAGGRAGRVTVLCSKCTLGVGGRLGFAHGKYFNSEVVLTLASAWKGADRSARMPGLARNPAAARRPASGRWQLHQ